MYKWLKMGRVFDPRTVEKRPWMKEFAQSPSVVFFENHLRVYFCCRPLPDANGMYKSYIGYVDFDKNNVSKIIRVSENPVVQHGGLGSFDEFGTYPVSAIRDGDEIRIYYSSFARCESVPFNAAVGVATSKDNGETFSKIGQGPVLSYSYNEPFVLGSPRIRKFNGKWYLWYVSGQKYVKAENRAEPVYKIRMAVSDDGLNWKKIGVNLLSDVLEENECQASPDVTFANGKYHMFFSFRYNLDFKKVGRGYRFGYAHSTDLLNWERDDMRAGMDVSAEGWDSETVSYGHLFMLKGDTFMFYQGNEMGRYGFGLAKLDGKLN
jgi:predicted GH43/DUF377 family glycosyl hydrolase